MVINESGMLKAMKDSCKGAGYHVAYGVVFSKLCYLIAAYGYEWSAVIQESKMPRKVLGLLAEHIGRLPDQDEAFLCRKDTDAQEEIYSVATKPILVLLGQAQTAALPRVKKTRLTWDGANVWQSAELEKVVLMRPDYEKIVAFKDTRPQMVSGHLCVEGQLSHVMLQQQAPGESDKDLVASLGNTLWI